MNVLEIDNLKSNALLKKSKTSGTISYFVTSNSIISHCTNNPYMIVSFYNKRYYHYLTTFSKSLFNF